MTKKVKRTEVCDEAVGLLITYRCNLNCTYCYIHKKKPKDMTLEMAQSILEPFLNKAGGLLDIKFYGGETLIAFDVIRELVEWVDSKNWSRKYRFFGSTNGTLLTSDMKVWLREHSDSLTLGLSFDGIPDVQLANRGNSEIDVDFFISTWPNQTIQMTVNAESVNKMADGVAFLLSKGARVHPNVAYEGHEWSDEAIREYGNQLYKLIKFYQDNENMPLINQFVHDLREYAENINNHKHQYEMCGAGNGFSLFDIDGKSYPCHLFSPLVLEGVNLDSVTNGLVENTNDFSDPKCKHCPFTTSCPTCIACNFLYRDNLRKRDSTHCKIMLIEVKAFIKKEVLRLSKKITMTPDDAALIDAIIELNSFFKMKGI